jgi:hypothetical protein
MKAVNASGTIRISGGAAYWLDAASSAGAISSPTIFCLCLFSGG